MKPFSQACENNKQPILDVLQRVFKDCKTVLEIGSGTGQHAAFFAEHLPHLYWQTSDLKENHAGIRQWIASTHCSNIGMPIELDVGAQEWQHEAVDGVFTANTLHIMSWLEVQAFFQGLPEVLLPNATLAVYGPFNYNGKFTSDSNRQFNAWLKGQAPHRAIRDFEAVNQLAEAAGLMLVEDNAMPANNRLLVWQKNKRK